MIIFTVSLICALAKNLPNTIPTKIPTVIPNTMDIGIFRKLTADISPVCDRPRNAEKRTITNTSSTDAPASISCGMLLSLP